MGAISDRQLASTQDQMIRDFLHSHPSEAMNADSPYFRPSRSLQAAGRDVQVTNHNTRKLRSKEQHVREQRTINSGVVDSGCILIGPGGMKGYSKRRDQCKDSGASGWLQAR